MRLDPGPHVRFPEQHMPTDLEGFDPITPQARRDAVCCSIRCRQAWHRFLRGSDLRTILAWSGPIGPSSAAA